MYSRGLSIISLLMKGSVNNGLHGWRETNTHGEKLISSAVSTSRMKFLSFLTRLLETWDSSQADGAIQEVKIPITFDYVTELHAEVHLLRTQNPKYSAAQSLIQGDIAPSLTSTMAITGKDQQLQRHTSRFNQGCGNILVRE